jgi:hypothetical protein
LAIVQDVLAAYGWRLELSASELGGLSAELSPEPARAAPADPNLEQASH